MALRPLACARGRSRALPPRGAAWLGWCLWRSHTGSCRGGAAVEPGKAARGQNAAAASRAAPARSSPQTRRKVMRCVGAQKRRPARAARRGAAGALRKEGVGEKEGGRAVDEGGRRLHLWHPAAGGAGLGGLRWGRAETEDRHVSGSQQQHIHAAKHNRVRRVAMWHSRGAGACARRARRVSVGGRARCTAGEGVVGASAACTARAHAPSECKGRWQFPARRGQRGCGGVGAGSRVVETGF